MVTEQEPTSIDDTATDLPVQISLGENYPNPFNPTTQIPFELNRSTKVTLEVYDMMGRRVKVLIDNQAYSPGMHTVSFDASNLASGVYLYTMKTPEYTQTRKLNFIK